MYIKIKAIFVLNKWIYYTEYDYKFDCICLFSMPLWWAE
jgi:hypothetical protein